MENLTEVNINPEPSIYFALKFVPSTVWYALAEFIDNSIASYQANEIELKKVEDNNYKLNISIEINKIEDKLTIKDNAGGIFTSDFQRAFRAGNKPLNRDGLSEFGMGMKYAACWFADEWKVISKALKENVERTVVFNINEISEKGIDKLKIDNEVNVSKNDHYTIIQLKGIKDKFAEKDTIDKVRTYLSSIYRYFLRNGLVSIYVNSVELKFQEVEFLEAPEYKKSNENGKTVKYPINEAIKLWKKDLQISVNGFEVSGFAGLRKKGSTDSEGIILLRRNRVISGLGSGGKPEKIFRRPNSATYQRLFCELYIDKGFDVSFTKQLQTNENYNKLIDILYAELQNQPLNLLEQAENASYDDIKKNKKNEEDNHQSLKNKEKIGDIGLFSQNNQSASKQFNYNNPIKAEENKPQLTENTLTEKNSTYTQTNSKKNQCKDIEVILYNCAWNIIIEYSQEAHIDWIEIAEDLTIDKKSTPNHKFVGIRISEQHEFMRDIIANDSTKKDMLERLIATLIIAELTAQETFESASIVRRNINSYLKNVVKSKITMI